MDFETFANGFPAPGDAGPFPASSQTTPEPYGLAKPGGAVASAMPWSDFATPDGGGMAKRPTSAMQAGSVVVHGVAFPVFHRADFVNLLLDSSQESWKRVREGEYVGGDNGGFGGFVEDPKGNFYQRLELVHHGGDNGSEFEWVGRSPFGISQAAMQRHFRAGDRGNVMAGPFGGFQDTNFWPEFDGNGDLTGLTVKTGKYEGAYVPYVKGRGGAFVPDPCGAFLREYNTNNGDGLRARFTVIGFPFSFAKSPAVALLNFLDLVTGMAQEPRVVRPAIAPSGCQHVDPLTGPTYVVPDVLPAPSWRQPSPQLTRLMASRNGRF